MPQLLRPQIKTLTPDVKLAQQLAALTQAEPRLTVRDETYLLKLMRKKAVWGCFTDEQLVGFIMRYPLGQNYWELQSLYLNKSYRGHGMGKYLLEAALKDTDKYYLASVFEAPILKTLKDLNFKETRLSALPKAVQMRYLFSRQVRSIFKHCFRQSSTLLQRF